MQEAIEHLEEAQERLVVEGRDDLADKVTAILDEIMGGAYDSAFDHLHNEPHSD